MSSRCLRVDIGMYHMKNVFGSDRLGHDFIE